MSDTPLFKRSYVALALLFPVVALALQWVLWPYLKPFVWFLFFPAVFFSARLGGRWGGLASTALSALFVLFFFIPPQLSWAVANPSNLWSVGVFLGMGYLFSDTHQRLAQAKKHANVALEETRAANVKITQLYEKTREVDELKTRFFANVSHELRTPLTLILGPLDKILGEPGLEGDVRKGLEVVQRNARLLHRQVDDLLDVAQLEAKRMTMRYTEIDLAQMVRVTASHFESVAADRDIAYTVSAPDTLPAQVDAEKCERILLNLLSNAFKFTPDSGTVSVALRGEGPRAVLEVRDSGPGIPADMRESVFERFRQVEGGSDRTHGGTGLGLAIVKEFAELHAGSASVCDGSLGGADFEIVLPVSAPAGTTIGEARPSHSEGAARQATDELRSERRPVEQRQASSVGADAPLVLVVEDNPDMNAYLAAALGERYRVATAFDGGQGFEMARSLRPDLVLSDIMMPGVTGDRMVSKLRRLPGFADVPFVMLTAKADDDLRVRLLREGVRDYLSKPVSIDELLARVGGLLAERQREKEALEESEARFTLILQTNPNAMLVVGMDGHIARANEQAEHLFGYDTGAMVGLRAEDLLPERQQADHAERRKTFSLDPHERPMGPVDDLLVRRRDGSEFPIELSMGTLRIQKEPYAVVTVVDISERRRAEIRIHELNADLEHRVEQRTAELSAANRELEAFSYAVSHDLRAPLRAMSGFSKALEEDHSGELDDEAKEFLGHITQASTRMSELIDGLLALSRTTRGELARELVDVSALAEEVLAEQAANEPERAVHWAVEPGLTVVGDPRMVAVALTNLLGNAWKYTSLKTDATIEVFSEDDEGGRWICVKDDGAGFDPRHASHLFQPFERLHRQDEFPGIGIGLATVQRIAHRHGGEVRASGAPGAGAEFCFRLPQETPSA